MRRIVTIILCIAMCLCTAVTPVVADGKRDFTVQEGYALTLKELGLFKGVSDNDFDLERAPTRVEALVMLIRVLGNEKKALEGEWEHPFDDVPSWADLYVGYAYENGLTNGVSPTKFGSGDATAAMYLTFVLRALGYSDADGKDFTWSDPFGLAGSVGIVDDSVDIDNFLRADVATVSYLALGAKVKETADTLADKLIDAGVFSVEQYGAVMNAKPAAPSQKLSAVEISERCASAVFYIEVYSYSGNLMGSGSGFFIGADGFAVTNFHVIANSGYMVITTVDGKKYDNIRVVDANDKNDVALLKVTSSDKFNYLDVDGASEIKQGQVVYAIGSPKGLNNTLSQGIVSNVSRKVEGIDYIQISVPIDSGSSGGALIDEYGKVIAITSAGYTDTSADLNLAVPIRFAQELDRTNLSVVKVWDDVYYPGFKGVYDFGSFVGIESETSEYNGFECSYTYGASQIKAINPIDEKLPNLGVDAVFNECVAQYKKALSVTGFVYKTTENGWMIYEKGDITVKLNAKTSGEKNVSIAVSMVPQYYKEAAAVPDFAKIMMIPASEPVISGDAVSYTYAFEECYENNTEFLVDLVSYSLLLEYEGFSGNISDYEQSDDKVSVSIIGNGYSVDMIVTEKDFTVRILPVSKMEVPEAFGKLRDYLIANGEYNENDNRYSLENANSGAVYDVTFYANTGIMCFGMVEEWSNEKKDAYIWIDHTGNSTVNLEHSVRNGEETTEVVCYAIIDPKTFSSTDDYVLVYRYDGDKAKREEYIADTVERCLKAIRFCDERILPRIGVSAEDLGFENIYN